MSGVSENLAAQLTEEELREMPMVDLVHKILQSKGEPMLYRDLLQEVARLKGFSEEESMRYIAQLFTEINIDGRFVCVGRSLWGLKHWYPTEQTTDSAVAGNIKDDYDDEDLDEELYEEEEEEVLDQDEYGESAFEDFDGDDDFPDDEEDTMVNADMEDEEDNI
ncbi:DNA-directed RNA polymerase subunit delta [Planifilum fimeticola]|uniref:Probable DNA-directed RNA polymerase subunit delta n=1 Tax=Planifilum fimeticola TaxID=201975 RepID=A0A2T0LI59_9BACL|nr:DNA-directed RNA polymerase subunit delta [Planifilum fimeticola]